jgi:erythrin-vacuolar iron transport family protein
MFNDKLTPLEAVAFAVRSEMESTNLYAKLIEKVRNPEVKRMLTELAEDEEEHRIGLMNLYRRMLGDEEPSIPLEDGRKKSWEIDPDAEPLLVMSKARDKELDSEQFYQDAAKRVQDFKTRMFFIELAETERRHAIVLGAQVEKLKADPHWFDRVDDKAVHMGP